MAQKYEKFMDHPAYAREDKLVVSYFHNPSQLSRGMFSTIDALVHAAPEIRAQITDADPRVPTPHISVRRLADAVDRYNDGDLEVIA